VVGCGDNAALRIVTRQGAENLVPRLIVGYSMIALSAVALMLVMRRGRALIPKSNRYDLVACASVLGLLLGFILVAYNPS
jgi:hypothetical protein